MFSCFKPRVKAGQNTPRKSRPPPFLKDASADQELDRRLYEVSKKYKIAVLPIQENYDLDNLYPITDKVELWTILVVGNDKTYIHVSNPDPFRTIPNLNSSVLNKKADNLLPEEFKAFLDPLWDKTLIGNQLQFYMVVDGRIFFVNTYPFYNQSSKVIGAILFMRKFDTITDVYTDSE
jgi:hypothetical protein